MGPIVTPEGPDPGYLDGLLYVRDARGGRPWLVVDDREDGFFVGPRLFDATADMDVYTDEIFR